jgi:hypothetical protein
LPPPAPPRNAREVAQRTPPDVTRGPDPAKPYFQGPRTFVHAPPLEECPVFSRHNHCPALVNCPNGDLLAIWYTCQTEPGRELGIVASRLPYGAGEWQLASEFWDAPDRNDHAPALWVDEKGILYHFNGLSAAGTWGSLATILRTSSDNGATWSKARLIMPEHGLHHMPVESVIRSREGAILVPCDAVTGGNGGTAILVSRDQGRTWTDPGEGRPAPQFADSASGAWIAGIHAGFVQLAEGRLLAFGRGNNIDGRMPMSLSDDLGQNWSYRASPFPPLGGGQRLAILRLREGPILFCSFGHDVRFRDALGHEQVGSGLFAALSNNEGESWEIKRLITDDGPPQTVDGGGNTGRFTLSPLSAEPKGYLSICQAANGLIHLISSKQHYAFNLSWVTTPPPPPPRPAELAPGIVIDHSPASSGLYIGSPSIIILPTGEYLASHDFFGPKSAEFECPTVRVFRSSDRGLSWKQVARLQCLFWPGLFTHREATYLMGTDKHHGRIVIRRSTDAGESWTEPRDTTTGLLTPEGEYHTAPMPVIEHNGRFWRAFEDAMGGVQWGKRYRAMMLSVPVDADLLNATNWTFSSPLPRDPAWLNGEFNGWLEGNAVLTPDHDIVDILRVDTPTCPERAAVVNISSDGKTASFNPDTGFIQFPGGAKKFTIRFDPQSQLYWSLATIVPEQHEKDGRPGGIRNTLALTCSPDLRKWEVRSILLYHPDVKKHGFQYPDWQFEGDDIIAAVRTAYDDGLGGAHNNHDANLLIFHRIPQFRTRTMADSVPIPGPGGSRPAISAPR